MKSITNKTHHNKITKFFSAFFLFLCLSTNTNGQIILSDFGDNMGAEILKSDYSTADIDQDGIMDSVYYDFKSDSLIISLSTNNFIPLQLNYPIIHTTGKTTLNVRKGGIEIYSLDMRTSEREQYGYERESKRFRLQNYSHERFTMGIDCAIGVRSLNLMEGKYSADWNYYNCETDSLDFHLKVDINIDNAPIYLGDSESFTMPAEDFFTLYREEYKEPSCDTIKFWSTNNDYDYTELMGKYKDGSTYWGSLMCEMGNINKSDIISVKHETVCYVEPGDGSIRIAYKITSVDKLQNGKLSDFIANTKKTINYRGENENLWHNEYKAPQEVAYFLALTSKKKILHYLNNKKGFLDVLLTLDKSNTSVDLTTQFLFAEIWNEHNNKKEFVCKLILEFEEETVYYLLNERTEKYEITELNED